MTRVLLLTSSPEFEERFHFATGGAYLGLHGPLPDNVNSVLARLNGAPPPDVVVLDGTSAPDHGLGLASHFQRDRPGLPVILVSRVAQEIGVEALRAGVRDVLSPDAEIADIHSSLDRSISHARASVPPPSATPDSPLERGRVISVASPKGGVGKTTVATNIAVGLAKAHPSSTVVVDLDVQFGDVATALNLSPDYSLLDTVRGPASHDTMALKTFLTLHETGLYAICAPESPAASDTITAEEVGRLVQMLASQFRYVVVDTAPGLSEHTLAAMDQTTDLVLVTSMDVPGVRGLRKELDILAQLDLSTETRQIVLNLCDPRGGLSLADVTATIGTAVDFELPISALALASMNQGVPILQREGKDPLARQLGRLVEALSIEKTPMSARGRHASVRGLGRLVGR